MQPVFIALVLAFVVFVVVDEFVHPWSKLMTAIFLWGVCNMTIRYLRPDLHFDLYRRYWPIKLHPLVRAEGDLLYRQLRQLAFSMGERHSEQQPGASYTPSELGEA